MSYFGETLKELRKEKQLTQKQLAKILNVSKATIGFWENGKIEPNNQMLITLAKYFDYSVSELLGETPIEKTISPKKLNRLNKVLSEIDIENMSEEEYEYFLKTAVILSKGFKQ